MEKKIIILAVLSAIFLVNCSNVEKTSNQKQDGFIGKDLPQGFMPIGQGMKGDFPGGGLMPMGSMKPLDTSWVKTKYTDISYVTKSKTQKLDIYLPNNEKESFPVVIEFHPGGFMFGEKSSSGLEPILKGALKRGYAVVSVSYRLSSEAKFPAALNDAKGAIKFLRANASKYNLDPNKFATWGESAGSNLSAMIAVSGDIRELEDNSMGYADVSSKVQAAIDWFGPLSFATMDSEFKALGTSGMMGATNSSNSAESKYVGKVIGTKEGNEIAEKTNPNNYITKDDVPMYIEHGTADRNVPITQSINFSKNLAKVIGEDKVFFTAIEGAGHGGPQFETDENINKMLDFLDKYLK